MIANTENNRVDVINFFGDGRELRPSAYDSDDRFAVGTFGSGDIDADGIPDRVELLGIRDDKGNLLFDLKSRGASPCRKDVVVEVDHMTGVAPDKAALDNASRRSPPRPRSSRSPTARTRTSSTADRDEPDHPPDRSRQAGADPVRGHDQRERGSTR